MPIVATPNRLLDLRPQLHSWCLVRQFFGATLIAEALITWGLHDIAPGGTRQTHTFALFAEAVIGLVTSLIPKLSSVMNRLGWTVVDYRKVEYPHRLAGQ